jgi:cytosine/adenosine deaminase-related metal-dependent hydrolase
MSGLLIKNGRPLGGNSADILIRNGRHCLIENGEVVFDAGTIAFVGRGYAGEVARRVEYGNALVGPGFIDFDGLSDLDTTILGYDNQPAWKKGRVWPADSIAAGPAKMCTSEELAFQKAYAFANLIRNGISTALPIASLFYREWGETVQEFEDAAATAAETRIDHYPHEFSGGQRQRISIARARHRSRPSRLR